jgi:hypothetical protein
MLQLDRPCIGDAAEELPVERAVGLLHTPDCNGDDYRGDDPLAVAENG